MARKVFLAVEGPNDGGALGRANQIRTNDPKREGAVQPLMRAIADDDVEFVGLKLMLLDTKGIAEPQEALAKRALVASHLALNEQCEALVLHADVDGPDDGSLDDGRERWAATISALDKGVAAAATNVGLEPNACIALVPLRTIESWLLADPVAVAHVAKPQSSSETVDHPEDLWDVPNVSGNDHPKQVLRRMVGGARAKVASRDYQALAATLRLDVVEERCPISFPPFREAVAEIFGGGA